ncbi:hypothetical protein FAVG1_12977 [Fusarium avenaceum]|nr:hypothetical protein FAVG1_12977 [Fusarium avenaceum]
MARFQDLPPELFDGIHKHCDPESRLNLLQVSRQFYELYIQSHLKHVKLLGSQGRVSALLARLLDTDDKGRTMKNLKGIRTASIEMGTTCFYTWEGDEEGRTINWHNHLDEDDTIVPRVVSLIKQATGLKFLKLDTCGLPEAEDERFRQMLKETGKWTIQTIMIRSWLDVTLACLDKCDPMHLVGVGIVPEEPEDFVDEMGVSAPGYKALKNFYKMRDDSDNQRPLLKRLFFDFWTEPIYPDIIGMVKKAFDRVEFVTKDFPNLEWLIIPEGDHATTIAPVSIEHNLQAWEDLFELFITKLKGTKLVKLAFFLSWTVLRYSTEFGAPGVAKGIIYFRVQNWATQSESGNIECKRVRGKPKQTFYEFPYGVLDTWA